MVKIKTIELVGSEVEVSELDGQNVDVQNLGDESIYASAYPNVRAGADNVAEIPAGSGFVVHDAHGTIYLLGTGKVQCTGTNYATPNFKMPSSSRSGGGGEKSEKGMYVGVVTEFVRSDIGVTSRAIEYSSDYPARLAEILAEVTGWELQEDGVTVLKGGVGFKFSPTYVYLVNDQKLSTTYDFRYINGSTSNGLIIDICTSPDGVTAFGCRGRNPGGTDPEMHFPFVLARNANGEDAAMAEYTGDKLYLLFKGTKTPDILTLNTLSKNTSVRSMVLTSVPDDTNSCLFNGLFFLMSYSGTPDGIFSIGGKQFRLLTNKAYSAALLAIPI